MINSVAADIRIVSIQIPEKGISREYICNNQRRLLYNSDMYFFFSQQC